MVHHAAQQLHVCFPGARRPLQLQVKGRREGLSHQPQTWNSEGQREERQPRRRTRGLLLGGGREEPEPEPEPYPLRAWWTRLLFSLRTRKMSAKQARRSEGPRVATPPAAASPGSSSMMFRASMAAAASMGGSEAEKQYP